LANPVYSGCVSAAVDPAGKANAPYYIAICALSELPARFWGGGGGGGGGGGVGVWVGVVGLGGGGGGVSLGGAVIYV